MTRPKPLRDGYYRLTSERVSGKSMAQLIRVKWHLIGEIAPVTLSELHRRGWDIHSRVKGMKN